MNKRTFCRNRLFTALIMAASFVILTAVQTSVHGQADGWIVWVKTSPCSGRMDWVQVATRTPTGQGGSSYWETADRVMGGLRCGGLGSRCTKAQAEAEVATVRTSPRFKDYCCREYSIWRNTQTNKLTIVIGKFGTPGIGWEFEDGPMCCDEAERVSGLTGACNDSHGSSGSQRSHHQTDTALDGKNLTYYQRQTVDQCEADCNANAKCKGYTWIQAGTYNPGDPAMCYLMEQVTGTNPSRGHVSGMKSGASTTRPTGGGTVTGIADMSGTWTADWGGSGCKWSISLSKTGANTYSGYFDMCSSTRRKDPVSLVFHANGTAEMTLTLPTDGVRRSTVTYTPSTIIYSNTTFRR